MLFHVPKTGCRVESLQLASLPKIERALVLFLIVSWRIVRLMQLGRTCPDLPATLLFEPDEITAAFVLANKPVPTETPTLNEVVRRSTGRHARWLHRSKARRRTRRRDPVDRHAAHLSCSPSVA